MINKLKSLYPNLKISVGQPIDIHGHYHWFSNDPSEWIGIPKGELLENQLLLLKTIFESYYHEAPISQSSPISQEWYSFLFENGSVPHIDTANPYRLTHFQWLSGGNISPHDIESAIQAFFDSNIILVWTSRNKGIIIESKNYQALHEQEYIAMIETLKADFFIELRFYIGKFRHVTIETLPSFKYEEHLFERAQQLMRTEKLFHFEKIVPEYLAESIPDSLLFLIKNDIWPVFQEDNELFTTIQFFIENNMNASITAKKLFIHRNTLQYRLDKFAEKTGIILKDFHSIITVYLACILFRTHR